MREQAGLTGKGHDAPIDSPADDLLDGLGVARAVHRFLRTTPPGWSTRVGLFGRWGSGKTSILNLLRTLEQADGAIVISFSAWSASGEAGVIGQFYTALTKQLTAEQIDIPKWQIAKRFGAKLRSLSSIGKLGVAAGGELVPLPPTLVKAGIAILEKLGSATLGWTKVSETDLQVIAELLRGRRVVVFIDDLDRADPKLIPKTLLALRELLDWPGFAFVLAFDKRAIASALSSYSTAFGEDADGFLEKVIDVPFEVPAPSKEHRKKLARAAFLACCERMPNSCVDAIAEHLPSQPRRIKIVARMMGSLGPATARHSIEEVDWLGLALFLILMEARADVAAWVVREVSDEHGTWLSWASDREERRKKEEEVRSRLASTLASPNPPDDADRVIRAAIALIEHWAYTSSETIAYWSRLAFTEPSITMGEMHTLRDDFAINKDHQVIEAALSSAARYARVSEEEAAADILQLAMNCYGVCLDSMASANTMADLEKHRDDAERSLLLLEYLYSQCTCPKLATTAAKPTAVIPLLELVSRWIGWTRNECELALRQRERDLALAAASHCDDPAAIFSSTDPFYNRCFGEDAQMVRALRSDIRGIVGPVVVAQICARFLDPDGLMPVSSDNDNLAAWLVESEKSPLYTDGKMTAQLLDTLRSGASGTEEKRSTLSKNARLFLKQLLFQTRNASWGGIEHSKSIHKANPLIIPAAWQAVVDVPAPFRMHSALRQLRLDFIELGVAEPDMPVPPWLAEPKT